MNISGVADRIAVAIFVALVAVAPLTAGQGHRGGKDRREKIEKALKRVDLTQEQKTQIKAIRDQFKSQHSSLIEELKTAHEQMRDARKSGNREQAEELRTAMAPKVEQLRAAREQMKTQILALLTPEQRAELEKMKGERKERKDRKGEARGKVKAQQGKVRDAALD